MPDREAHRSHPGAVLVVDGRAVATIELATTRRSRARGLLGRTTPPPGGLWITPCRQVHTMKMRFPIDVAFVARSGRVLHTTTMPPGRWSRLVWGAAAVLEAAEGSFTDWQLDRGTTVELRCGLNPGQPP